MSRSAIRESLKITGQPGLISFSGGWPHPESFPVRELQEINRDILQNSAAFCLQYCPTEGLPELRKQLLLFSNELGLKVREEELLVTSGSQQALDLLSRVFIDPGDLVVTENPSFVSAIAAFRGSGARFLPAAMDTQGLVPEELSASLEELQKTAGGSSDYAQNMPKFIYTIPDFQNPTGLTLSVKRRTGLLEIAERFDLLVVEDIPYRWLRYRGKHLPLLGADSRPGRVIKIFSLSKIMAPGLRIAWIIGERSIIDKLVAVKQAADLCTGSFTQLMAAEFLRRGFFQPAVKRISALYRGKMQAMLETLQERMPALPGLQWTVPQGGVFIWLTLPAGMDSSEMLREAVERQIAYVPGTAFFPTGGGTNNLRLNFTFPTERQIRDGIVRLARVVRGHARRPVRLA
jgi:2-aminoadipate transaminase